MAEFQEVMRQWRRMCEKNQADCMRFCPICANLACGDLTEATDEDIRKAENAIMTWSAEHPEPVYPTWMEWLTDVGAIPKVISWDEPLVEAVYDALQKHIPADIAQKLGIEPKGEER